MSEVSLKYIFFAVDRQIWAPFFQVTSSAVRPLTNIPHCCTYLPWDFFIPNVVDQPFQLRLRELRAC